MSMSTLTRKLPRVDGGQQEQARSTSEMFHWVRQLSRTTRLATGESLSKLGPAGEAIYLLQAGRVVLYASHGEDRASTIYGAGDLFGEISLDGSVLCDLQGLALDESTIWQLPRERVLQLLGDGHVPRRRLARIVAHKQDMLLLFAD